MPTYRFISRNGDLHELEMDLPDDQSAKNEAKNAFVEAVRDLSPGDELEISMRVETNGREIYAAEARFSCRDKSREEPQ
jgi:hypothetical protein